MQGNGIWGLTFTHKYARRAYKNESMDILSDDELLEYMKDRFDGECGGSLDNLEESVLDEYAREVREQGENFLKRRGDE